MINKGSGGGCTEHERSTKEAYEMVLFWHESPCSVNERLNTEMAVRLGFGTHSSR